MVKKSEIRVFVDPVDLKNIDLKIKQGNATNRSEMVRVIIRDWFKSQDVLEDHERRLKALEAKLKR